jgi:hypothetical protein
VSAAELMCRVLGADDHRFVVIPHPISSANTGLLASAARQAADDCAALLTTAEHGDEEVGLGGEWP